MQKQIFLLSCLFFLGITFGAAQWTQKKGTGYYKVGAWFLEADQHYTDQGLLDPNATRGVFVTKENLLFQNLHEYTFHDG